MSANNKNNLILGLTVKVNPVIYLMLMLTIALIC